MVRQAVRASPHVVGDARPRRLLALAVVGLLLLASGGFALGFDVGLSLWWIALAFGLAVAAGVAGAGLVPTVGSLWLVGCWWFAFPPFVGYLTGNWAGADRYTYPRMLGCGYETARAELIGGFEIGVRLGLQFAVVLGLVGYAVGMGINRSLLSR
ncbi:hypothetical protein C463_05170 [Halorubrum californiense DSM 19288]|uniref:Uncharacterized protein n=1 Tax=Halorubrum californiense DSM 19288 TaxID=1227465 RepID=M0EDH0_9EURY|nr:MULTISPECIES: hypothetical protein [Halorubrum]ELZ45800.1 hypothetical protein C463_05170 [Halorubrum californiense DSM 19288]TKX65068.1 hypothetical protein EXE40_17190 [Halorubrum sp. GN11GM_10-3_MGM]